LDALTDLHLIGEDFRDTEIGLDRVDVIQGDDGISRPQVAADTDLAQAKKAFEGGADGCLGELGFGQPQVRLVQSPLGISFVPFTLGDGLILQQDFRPLDVGLAENEAGLRPVPLGG
jgi:hypothetical protein